MNVKNKILQIVSVFETSSVAGNYGALVIMNDGKDGRRQITYGLHQATEWGTLHTLVSMYVAANGMYSDPLRPYLNSIGRISLVNDNNFIQLLRKSADDEVMKKTQDAFFDQLYWEPAERFFKNNGFTLPLAMAVIYDSYIHSGGVPSWLRDDFSQVPPSKGGDQKEWVSAYVNARDNWLENNKSDLLRKADYRTDCWKEQIQNNNWDLTQPVTCKFNSEKPSKWITIN